MAASVKDVARHAGVSVSTVSYVLSGNRPISEGTKQRVLASIEALGFQPHAGARSIRAGATDIFALVMPIDRDVRADVQMRFVLGVLRAARAKGKNLLLLPAEDGVDELTRLTAGSAVDGVLAMEVQVHDPRVPTLANLSKPVVLIGTPEDPQHLAHVDFDFTAAGALCARYLADLGHQSIAYLGQPAETFDREAGYAVRARNGALQTLHERGIHGVVDLPVELGRDGASEAIERMFRIQSETTGLIIYNEQALTHLLLRLEELGIRVPADMSIVAICPEAQALDAHPPVSNVSLPAAELGTVAVDHLLQLIDGRSPEPVVLPPTLVARGTASRRSVPRQW
ncbi:LacI family DNA-binding transcriptional regulator [Dactylosporangium sp. NPDC051485]|uniref:LacI family DNA-binding transcriptional regulator n=1 Tax=Dactylosporangium sp. NPDC051485 TaxID=3154846 RepID=UPI00342EB425